MKRNLIMIAAAFLSIIVLLLAGNVIIVGEKLGEICHTVYAEYAFYALIAVLLVVVIAIPVIKVHAAPEFPTLSIDEDADARTLFSFGKRLAANCSYIADEEKRREHQNELNRELQLYSADADQLKTVLDREVQLRFEGDEALGVKGISSRMKDWARSVFLITAISQNSMLDSAVVMIMNYRQVEDLVSATGFRPTRARLFRIYSKILGTALAAYCTSEIVSDLAGEGALAGVLASVKIPGVVAQSATQGAVNALLTLRIAYVTRTYLMEGPDALAGRENRRKVSVKAFKDAIKAVPGIIVKNFS